MLMYYKKKKRERKKILYDASFFYVYISSQIFKIYDCCLNMKIFDKNDLTSLLIIVLFCC